MLFDPDSGETAVMRTKEDAHDYRYFPDPDLPPLLIDEAWISRIEAELPELPLAMQQRFETQHGLSAYDARSLTAAKALAAYYESTVAGGAEAKQAANWIMGDVSATLNREECEIDDCPVSAAALAVLIGRVGDKTINHQTAREVWRKMWETGQSADEIIAADGLKQESDSGAIEIIVDQVMAANAGMVAEYRSGKEKVLSALIGQCMKASRGRADPAQVTEVLKQKLAA